MESQKTVYKLLQPFEWDRRIVDSLELRRLKVKDIQSLPKNETESAIELLCRSLDEIPAFVKELDVEDFTEVSKIISGFFGKSQETGKTSSDGSPTE